MYIYIYVCVCVYVYTKTHILYIYSVGLASILHRGEADKASVNKKSVMGMMGQCSLEISYLFIASRHSN